MYDKQKMQDIKYSELPLLNEYQEYYANRNIGGIKNLLTSSVSTQSFLRDFNLKKAIYFKNLYIGITPSTISNSGVYYSSQGYDWTYVQITGELYDIVNMGSTYVFLATSNGIFRSSDGITYEQVDNTMGEKYNIVSLGLRIYCGLGQNGYIYSDDIGSTWQLETLSGVSFYYITKTDTTKKYVFFQTSNGIYYIYDNGSLTQSNITTSSSNTGIVMGYANSCLILYYVATSGLGTGGIYYFDFNTNTFVQTNITSGSFNQIVFAETPSGIKILIGNNNILSDRNFYYCNINNIGLWNQTSLGTISPNKFIYFNENSIQKRIGFISYSSTEIVGQPRGICYSVDGITWYQSNITTGNFSDFYYSSENDLFIAIGSLGVYYSVDGITWEKTNSFNMVNYSLLYGSNTNNFIAYRSANQYSYVINFKSSQLKYKILNAYNWNRILDLINDNTRFPEFSSLRMYYKGDWVTYQNNIYEAIRNSVFVPPTNTNYWKYVNVNQPIHNLTIDSIIGKWNYMYNALDTASTNFIYRGIWSSGVEYKKNNLVKVDNYNSYYCIANHTSSSSNQPPNATYWLKAKSLKNNIVGIPISSSQPSNIGTGDIWFEEI